MTTNGQRLARLMDNDKALAKENAAALRMQATVWRQIAMIACADPARAIPMAQLILFHTVPWVDGDYVTKFIADHVLDAEASGKKAGVFTS